MTDENSHPLVPYRPGAVEKSSPGAKGILSTVVADALVLAQKSSLSNARFRIGDHHFRESDFRQIRRVPTLTYTGKVWSITLRDGTKTNLTHRNDDGDVEPMQTVRVVIMDYVRKRGRTYYEGGNDPENAGKPNCWSDDGERPNAAVLEPKSSTCVNCPMSVKESKIIETGEPTTACSEHRNVVVLLMAEGMALPPLKLRLAITSLLDEQSPERDKEGWRTFDNYLDFLGGNAVKHTATLVTKMKFDPNAAYPKVIFSPERWVEPAELEVVKARMSDGSVDELMKLSVVEADSPAPATAAVTAPPPVVAPAPIKPKPVSAQTPEALALAKAADVQGPVATAIPASPGTTDVLHDLKALPSEGGND